jgi:hypothetical protein
VLHEQLGRASDLPTNVRLGWKWLTAKNATAYYKAVQALINGVKSFIEHAPKKETLRIRTIQKI